MEANNTRQKTSTLFALRSYYKCCFRRANFNDADNIVTLREAIELANTVSFGPDEILFDPSLDGETISLSNSLFITDSVTIDAQGQSITIDASGHDHVAA